MKKADTLKTPAKNIQIKTNLPSQASWESHIIKTKKEFIKCVLWESGESNSCIRPVHSPFSSRKLLKKQNCCRHWDFILFLIQCLMPPRIPL